MSAESPTVEITIMGVNPDRPSDLTWCIESCTLDYRLVGEEVEEALDFTLDVCNAAIRYDFAAACGRASRVNSLATSPMDSPPSRVLQAVCEDAIELAMAVHKAKAVGWTSFEAMVDVGPRNRRMVQVDCERADIGTPMEDR